jgi:hypothetical protein
MRRFEIRIYSVLDVTDRQRSTVISYAKELIRYPDYGLSRYPIDVLDGNSEYPEIYEGLAQKAEENITRRPATEQLDLGTRRARVIELDPLELRPLTEYLHRKSAGIEPPVPRNVVLTGQNVKYIYGGEIVGTPYGYGPRDSVQCVYIQRWTKREDIWHEVLHKLGIIYYDDYGGNCKTSIVTAAPGIPSEKIGCVMRLEIPGPAMCDSCYAKLHDYLADRLSEQPLVRVISSQRLDF